MQPKASKYDTNPLDEEVAHRADESFGSHSAGGQTEEIAGPTKPIIRNTPETAPVVNESEAPTRRIDQVTSYPSVFVPPPPRPQTYEAPRVSPAEIYQPPRGMPPNVYQPPPLPIFDKPGMRKVDGLGIQERWAALIPYIPAWLGVVGAIVELILVPRTETRVRFHASQALVLQLGMTAMSMLLTGLGFVSGRFTGASLFRAASIVILFVAMVKVWKGKPFAITVLEDARKWIDEKIKPRK